MTDISKFPDQMVARSPEVVHTPDSIDAPLTRESRRRYPPGVGPFLKVQPLGTNRQWSDFSTRTGSQSLGQGRDGAVVEEDALKPTGRLKHKTSGCEKGELAYFPGGVRIRWSSSLSR